MRALLATLDEHGTIVLVLIGGTLMALLILALAARDVALSIARPETTLSDEEARGALIECRRICGGSR